jgi:ATP-dependent Lon protease
VASIVSKSPPTDDTEDEKLQIAKRHLIEKAMENNGVKAGEISFKDSAILDIIRYYTREAGVRGLSRTISTISLNR